MPRCWRSKVVAALPTMGTVGSPTEPETLHTATANAGPDDKTPVCFNSQSPLVERWPRNRIRFDQLEGMKYLYVPTYPCRRRRTLLRGVPSREHEFCLQKLACTNEGYKNVWCCWRSRPSSSKLNVGKRSENTEAILDAFPSPSPQSSLRQEVLPLPSNQPRREPNRAQTCPCPVAK